MTYHVILTAGHRNTTGGGTPGEFERTPRFARAYAEVLRQAGGTVHYLQETTVTSSGRPDFYPGPLDQLAKHVAAIATSLPDERVVVLDLHIEDGAAPRGCFAIVPDDPHVPAGSNDPAADSWRNNAASRALAARVSAAIAGAAGFVVRVATEPGVMSERETSVGGKGSRLAMFRYTAALRDRMPRLIIEHGNIVKDRTIIDAPETAARCARAVADVLTSPARPTPLIT
jgi:hypothetical protein